MERETASCPDRERDRFRNLGNEDTVVVVLTPSANLDDQVAVENSAASQSLG